MNRLIFLKLFLYRKVCENGAILMRAAMQEEMEKRHTE